MGRHKVADVEDLPPGTSVGIQVENIPLAVFNVEGEFYAMHNRCLHKDGPMNEGIVNEDRCSVHCPWHAIEFDLKTGYARINDDMRMPVFDVENVDGELFIEV